MRIGLIWVGYQCEDMLERSLAPWIAARKDQLSGHEFVICAVSVPFEGFEQQKPDDTEWMLHGHAVRGEIDHYITSLKPTKETEARGAALRWLVERNVTYLWQIDADEFYTIEDIQRITAFVEANPWVAMMRLSLKNRVFTKDQYLVEPFTPARIHKVHLPGGHVACEFWGDNNVLYRRPWSGAEGEPPIRDTDSASLTVPQTVGWIDHATWLNDERSRRKVSYQTTSRQWQCSFAWDEVKGLMWNEAYFARMGLPKPEIARD